MKILVVVGKLGAARQTDAPKHSSDSHGLEPPGGWRHEGDIHVSEGVACTVQCAVRHPLNIVSKWVVGAVLQNSMNTVVG